MPSVEVTGRAGRPRFNVPMEQLQYLVDNKFTVPQMADMIGLSERTIHRRLSSNNLYIRSNYSKYQMENWMKWLLSFIRSFHSVETSK